MLKDRLLATVVSTLDTAKLFYRVKWSQVKEGDVILVQGDEEPLAEVTVKEVHVAIGGDGQNVILVYYGTYGVPRDPEGAAYVQSRF